MLLPDHSDFPLKYGICILVFFAILSAFTRHLWYMLARYFRKADLEEIILDVLARGRNKERQRDIIRFLVRASTGLVRLLLATLFLHGEFYPNKYFDSAFMHMVQNPSIWSSLSSPKALFSRILPS